MLARYRQSMEGEWDRVRASGVITALLREDAGLARKLVLEDENPFALAWGAVTIAAGMWDHHCRLAGKEPSEAWAASLLAMKRRS